MSKFSQLATIATNTDSYKVTMFREYPPGTEYVYSYIEARGGVYEQTVFMGLLPAIKQHLLTPITKEQILFAEKFWAANGMEFNTNGWMKIIENHKGLLPIRIKAVPEGSVIPVKNVLCTVENTDPEFYWLTTWVETMILRAIWYATTVCTLSWNVKQDIKAYLEKSGDVNGLSYKFHDFGYRGVSSDESAAIGATSHLVNFMGTDTVAALFYANEYYNAPLETIGHSINAAEHSTITSWLRSNEEDAYLNMIEQFGKPGVPVAIVSDSYDIYNACKMLSTGKLKQAVLDSGCVLVIRPDSGDPQEVLQKMLLILEKGYGTVVNSKGYKVLNNVRIIWGDGIDALAIKSILRTVVDYLGYSADNIAFGAGGGLLQSVNRDIQKWAMKCSSIKIRINDELIERDVYKDPITDNGKLSKKGRVTLYKSGNDYISGLENVKPTAWSDKSKWNEALVTYYENGILLVDYSLEEIRNRANII